MSKYIAFIGLILGLILMAGAGLVMWSQATGPKAAAEPSHDEKLLAEIEEMAKDPVVKARMPRTTEFILEKARTIVAEQNGPPIPCDADGLPGIRFGSQCVTAESEGIVSMRGPQFGWLSEFQGNTNIRTIMSTGAEADDLSLLTGLPNLTRLSLFGAQVNDFSALS